MGNELAITVGWIGAIGVVVGSGLTVLGNVLTTALPKRGTTSVAGRPTAHRVHPRPTGGSRRERRAQRCLRRRPQARCSARA